MDRLVLTMLLLAAVALGACGSDNAPSTNGASTNGASTAASDVSAKARGLATETRTLQQELAATARTLVESPDKRQQAMRRLEDQEQSARALAARARELPADEPSRDAIVRANTRAAGAARDLRKLATSKSPRDLTQARTRLQQASKELRSAANSLLRRTPPAAARQRLEDARKSLPELPDPSDLAKP